MRVHISLPGTDVAWNDAHPLAVGAAPAVKSVSLSVSHNGADILITLSPDEAKFLGVQLREAVKAVRR